MIFGKNRHLYKAIAPIVLVVCSCLLLLEPDWLLYRVNLLFGFHIGTIIFWIGMIACSLISLRLNKNFKKLRFVTSLSFYISIFFFFFTFILAGKNFHSFYDKASFSFVTWIIFCGFPPLILVISLICYFSLKRTEFKTRNE